MERRRFEIEKYGVLSRLPREQIIAIAGAALVSMIIIVVLVLAGLPPGIPLWLLSPLVGGTSVLAYAVLWRLARPAKPPA